MEQKSLSYQIQHIENIAKSILKHGRAIDASDTGTGKTYTTVKVALKLKLIPWIICPKSVTQSWIKVLTLHDIKKHEYHIITYEQLSISKYFINKDDEKYTWNMDTVTELDGDNKKKYLFIYDEAHKCKNSNTINSKILLDLSKYDVNILLLSATIIDKPLFFIPFGVVLKLFKTVKDGATYLNEVLSRRSKSTTNGYSHPLILLHEILFNEYASRMRIDETENIFMKNTIIFDGIDMENYYRIEEKYEELNKLIDKDIYGEPEGEVEVDTEDLVMDKVDILKKKRNQIQLIRQDIELLKIKTIHELTLKYLTEGNSIAIFVNFTKTIKELCSKLNTKCVIWGAQTGEERSKAIDDFSNDKSRIIICNIQSGSAGISLHDTFGKYPRISIISPTWSAQDLVQVLGRIHRAMGKTDCIQQLIFCKNTIEETVGNVIKTKINNIRAFNDGNKLSKTDGMENILKTEITRQKKKKEQNTWIYKTNDFEKIIERIENLEKVLTCEKLKLNTHIKNSDKWNEIAFNINKISDELKFNEYHLKKTMDGLLK